MWMAQTGNNDQFTFAAGFGRTSDGSNGETSGLGYDYLMMQPTRGGGDGSRGAISFGTFDGEVGVTDGSRDLNDGGLHHVVMTVNATDLAYYVDGMQIGVAPLSTIAGASLANVSNDLAYLGRALYPDPYFEGSIYEFSIWDNALSEAEVATRFTDGCIDNCGSRYLEINRISGEAQLINSLSDESIISYSLSSAAGSLNPAGWTSIADTGDANSGGSIDADDIWTVTSATGNNLAEEEPVGGGGPDDGAPLGGGFSLGNVWSKSRFEDVTLSLTILNPDFTERVENLSVQFVGNGGEAFSRSDLDVDGDIDADDYSALLSFHLNPLPGTTAFETAPFGDIDGDLDNDFDDFRLFKNDFIAANGAAAFAALSAVPEPSAALLALVAVASLAARRRCAAITAVAAVIGGDHSTDAVTIAHWDFETDLIAGTAVNGQNVSHPSINGAFDAAIQDISGNGNHLSRFSQDGAGFAVMQFSNVVSPSNRTGSNLSIVGAPGDCCEVLSSDGDLEVGGVKVADTLSAWTIEASVNFTDSAGWQTIVGKDGIGQATAGDVNQAPLYFQKKGDGTEQFRINYVDVTGATHIVDSTTTAVAGEWYNLAATNDGNTLRIYVNGVEEGMLDITTSADTRMAALNEAGFAGDDATSDAPYAWTVARGMYNDAHGDRVNGYIDDVRISDEALTPDQLLNDTIAGLTLVVNHTTGGVFIRNDKGQAASFDYYRIDSAGGALMTSDFNGSAGWDSLSDQDADAIGPGLGESWEEVAAANSSERLVEQFLQGSTGLNNGFNVSLGAPYTGGNNGDLEFFYSEAGSAALKRGTIEYTTTDPVNPEGLAGDYNSDGKVDAADYTVWRDGDSPDSSQAGYQLWRDNYGATSAAPTAAGTAPEPTAALLGAIGCSLFIGRRRR
ncbi:unnamed protein product [Ostreobium quekettii]|uniref:LamG-like jellyroll fold domain-containing protein n=1 Tax=Ostreobium quekettii TaxID=121088 RepID=A0A8S1IK79_9CHLO|nr:unnamed protein product [Ostreobium quekettii]